jgi:anthranilate phosphoribosyltransferase
VLELRDGAIRTYTLDPTDLGIPLASPASIRGGDAGCNAELAGSVLAGERSPHRDIVLLNAAAGLIAAGVADDLAEGLEAAAASVDSGKAADVLTRLVAVSNEAKAAEPAPVPTS